MNVRPALHLSTVSLSTTAIPRPILRLDLHKPPLATRPPSRPNDKGRFSIIEAGGSGIVIRPPTTSARHAVRARTIRTHGAVILISRRAQHQTYDGVRLDGLSWSNSAMAHISIGCPEAEAEAEVYAMEEVNMGCVVAGWPVADDAHDRYRRLLGRRCALRNRSSEERGRDPSIRQQVLDSCQLCSNRQVQPAKRTTADRYVVTSSNAITRLFELCSARRSRSHHRNNKDPGLDWCCMTPDGYMGDTPCEVDCPRRTATTSNGAISKFP
ncbi:hypothetical protein C8Q80DRAFT_610275 [Daedaleopsis nitida]|nr:hypothetical protein C8Q80DRAFT_610275 [Daedaleopsis nitida]